jgi:hypothetical protein
MVHGLSMVLVPRWLTIILTIYKVEILLNTMLVGCAGIEDGSGSGRDRLSLLSKIVSQL